MSRKKRVEARGSFYNQPHIVLIDLNLNGNYIKPGTLLKLKHDRTAWTYMCMYHNQEKDVQWIDLRSPMGFKSVRPDKIAGEYIQKKSRRKKAKADE